MYPYGYMSSIEKFHEGGLPPKEEFYSKLNDCDITDEDYEHAEKVYKEFDMKTMVITITIFSKRMLSVCIRV